MLAHYFPDQKGENVSAISAEPNLGGTAKAIVLAPGDWKQDRDSAQISVKKPS